MEDFERYVARLETRWERGGRESPVENLVILPSLESTNALARAVAAEYQNESQTLHPLLILALEQTGGRGRQGRRWSSPAGLGVYATRVVQVADPGLLQRLPLLVGVGLCRALAPVPCRLKWPNDLMVEVAGERRKIGGVLIEAAIRPGEATLALVGFGVNLLHGPADLPETGTSVHLMGGDGRSLEDFTWDLVEGLEAELAHLDDAGYAGQAVESYRALSIHRPGERIVCRVGETEIEGTFVGFDELGRLLLESDGRVEPIASGEVIEG